VQLLHNKQTKQHGQVQNRKEEEKALQKTAIQNQT
jgi:hypothetical protein